MTCCMSMSKKKEMRWFIHNTHKSCAFYVNINYEGNETVKRVNKKKKKTTTCTHRQTDEFN